ncbi:angiogenic factor with G patch and FHA domains 1 isoform X3 [Oncorhynchus mykiss]|uniref:angiogenic factor with G patch and FHA domains 1 isoform X3 n=1 Tax=Oncorhynchus mykiss TaxID=8022 RepID=UPI000B4FACF9|nr:angiogenic factor with G patch and FHA domains 1 isoform X3 [Oncorhynchus mykiss]
MVVTRCLCSTFRLIFLAERNEGVRPSEENKRIARSMATNGEKASGGEEGSDSEVAELRQKVESLKQELKSCTKELTKLQKQLTKSESLQKSTEGYNEDLRKQVNKLSAEIHERKKKAKERAEAETQTEEYTWSETDYYNYYYGGGYYQGDGVTTDTQVTVTPEGQEATDAAEMTAAESTTDTATDMTTDNATAMITEVSVEGGIAAAQPEEVDTGSIADMLRATAEQAMTQTGFVFDETTGMYYDHSTGFYYDSASQLYYDNNTGMYYYYDAESGKYQFHSRIEVPTVQPVSETSQVKKSLDKKGRKWKKVPERTARQDDKVEDVTNSLANMKISYFWNSASRRVAEKVWPPCVRVTVVRSPVLQTGTLFIITADSPATIGREKDMNHAISISEMGVSKLHAEVYFDQDQQCYMLVDQGSQNGTVLNGNRILQPNAKCDPCPLTHGDEVKMGETVLSFHIHAGTDTCDGCEPGQVMAHLSKHQRNQPLQTGPAPTKEDKELLRQKELKQMKVKYGLKSAEYEEDKALRNPRYVDRAESRRQTVGSEGVFQRDDAPASVHVEISEVNKGRKMLEKMGWKKGEGLGKDGAGMKDPIQLKVRKSQSGFGAGAVVSVDEAGTLSRTKTQRNWEKARERFNDTCQTETPTVKKEQSPAPKPWVKGEVAE